MDYCSNVADDGGIVVDLNLLVVCTLHSSELLGVDMEYNKNKKNYCIFVQISLM